MVTKMSYGGSVYGLLKYNEKKVSEAKARVFSIRAIGFSKENASFKNKWNAFKMREALNPKVKKNAYHFTLNFHPEDSAKMSEEIKQAIIDDYLQALELERQPAIVYEHFDAAHPHFHVVMTNIDSTGKRINVFQQVKHHSERARKKIELDYDLTKAEGRNQELAKNHIPLINGKAKYGKSLTKETLSEVIQHVRANEFYTNIQEYNNALFEYGVVVDRGPEDSPQRKNGGLVYGFVDENRTQVGRGIKASRFYGNPILKNLKIDFSRNNDIKTKNFNYVAKAINQTISPYIAISNQEFIDALQDKGISIHIDYDQTGAVKQISYKHSSGARYTADDFRINKQKLFAKISDYSYSYKEAKAISKIVHRRYHKSKRESGNRYESQFLYLLDQEGFLSQLEKENPEISEGKMRQSTKNFLLYKQKKFDKILQKDTAEFTGRTASLVRFIKENDQLYLRDKISFLNKMGIKVDYKDGKITFSHKGFENLAFRRKQSINELFKADKFDLFKTSESPEFKPWQKRFFHTLANEDNGKSLKEKSLFLIHHSEIKPFIPQNRQFILEQRLNKAVQNQVKENLGRGHIKSIEDILDNGFIVKPLKKPNGPTKYVAYYYKNSPATAIPISKDLEELLKKTNYRDKDYRQFIEDRVHQNNFTLNYKINVQLNRILHTGDYKKLGGLYKVIDKSDPEAGKRIAEWADRNYNGRPTTSKEYVELINTMKKEINSSLSKPKTQAKEKRHQTKQPKTLYQGGITASNERESEQEKLAKRLRKRWKKDLDHDIDI